MKKEKLKIVELKVKSFKIGLDLKGGAPPGPSAVCTDDCTNTACNTYYTCTYTEFNP